MAIDTSLSPLGTVSAYGAPSYGFSAPGTSSDPAQAGNPITASNDPSAVQEAVELSGDASAILSLGGAATVDTGLTYNAAGIFNSIVGAGPASVASTPSSAAPTSTAAPSTTDPSTSDPTTSDPTTATTGSSNPTASSPYPSQDQATQSYDQGLLGSLSTPVSSAGVYNAAGVFSGQGLSPQLSSLLQANPDLSGVVTSDMLNQGLVGGLLDTTA